MSNFSQFFKQFTESMAGGNNSAAISGLNNCFNLNPKVTFMRLYERNFLFNREFILLDKSFLQAPGEYLMLLNILQNQAKRLLFITNEFKGYSLGQILQGAANLLEKNNAELKYNEKWNVKYANANPDELELSLIHI